MNELNSLITVGLTVQDAIKFKQFCQYYDEINHILEADVFERVRPGEVILHISPIGKIGKIELRPVIVIVNK